MSGEIPSDTRFGWFWYNDQEILFDDEKAIAKKIEPYARQGITHLITFSCTHFRWNFKPWWPQINECIGRIVRSAHRCGIKVVEHHSSHLTNYPVCKDAMEGFHREFTIRHGDAAHWPGLIEYMLDNSLPYMKRRQINSENKPAWSPYCGFGQCFNNVEYVAEYFAYLTTVYEQGVDGIMTDDVQYYGKSCFCPTCRKLFQAKYGMELPMGEDWKKLGNDIRHPVHQAFLRFQVDSLLRFHQRVTDHCRSLGLNLLRPNYISNALSSGMTPNCIDHLPELSVLFQECCYPTIIRYCWADYWMEELHRAMTGRIRKIPHMMMFYADRSDSLLFSWGISRLAGALYTNTPEGESTVDECSIRAFEKRHKKLCFDGDAFRAVAFLDSRANAYRGGSYLASRLFFWIQSCLFHNIPAALVSMEHPEEFQHYRVLAVNEVGMLGGDEIRYLKDYAAGGGILIVTGRSGDLDENARMRSAEDYRKLWGFDLIVNADTKEEIPFGKGKIIRIGSSFGFPGTEQEKHDLFDDYPNRFRTDSIYELMNLRKHVHWVWVPRGAEEKNSCVDRNANYANGRKESKEVADFFVALLGETIPIRTENFPELVLCSAFHQSDSDAISLHLLNCMQTFPEEKGRTLSHFDPIPFPPWQGGNGMVDLLLPEKSGQSVNVFFHTLDESFPLASKWNDGHLQITLPAGMLKNYGMIEIQWN